jgi:hypothetical protein
MDGRDPMQTKNKGESHNVSLMIYAADRVE